MARKKGEIVVPTKPVSRATEITHFTFKSYDKNAGLLQFQIKDQDGRPTDLFGATVRLLMFIYSGDEKKEFPIFDHQIITESYLEGIVKYPIPDMLLSYEGKVDANIYIDFPDGSHTDNLAFTFTIEKSVIDWDIQLNGEYYFKDFQQLLEQVKAESAGVIEELLGDVKEVVDHANEQIVTMNEEVEKLVDKVNEASQQVENLGRFKRMYSNSIDFGNYDYSGNANLLPKITADHFSGGNGATVEDGPDGEIIFTLDGSAQLTKFNTSMRLPALQNGKRYTISAEIMLHEGLEGDASNIRLTNTYVPGGNIMLSTVRPSPTTTNIWHTIRGTQIATYATTLPQQWYVVLQDVTASSRIKGKISLRNIKIEEGSVATPYQPNLLVEPYHISKIPLNENLANKEQAFPINSRQYLVYSAEMIEPFIANQTYTLTLKGTKLGPQSFRVYTTGPNNTSNIGDMEIVEGLADTWRLTFTPTSANLNGSVSPSTLQIYQFPQATMGQVTIDSLKIEKGDIATPNISEHRYFGEGIKDSDNPNDYSWDITEEYIERRIADHIDKSEKEQENLFLTKTEASKSLMDLTTPQTVSALKKFKGGLLSNGINVGVEYAEAVTTDKYDNHGAVYLGGGVWLTWETLSFSNPSGWGRGSTIRVGNDGHPGFTYPDVPNIFGGYIWIGGSCLPDYTDGGFGAYHITVSNNFDDARQPIVRFIDSPTTPVKRLAVRGFALVFAPAPTTNSKVEEN
ncbi:BppU family phage baseplate upper protein [Enterococcus spodopteracolus]|uniref:BppU family phage baseplate upper protein n=1 Tax=Enterococcus spodopteracolus TaxID=3034501 RepID=UPI0026496514|nr:BppU family phage baseplate upper protein [Enterococcus spodopteracolus]